MARVGRLFAAVALEDDGDIRMLLVVALGGVGSALGGLWGAGWGALAGLTGIAFVFIAWKPIRRLLRRAAGKVMPEDERPQVQEETSRLVLRWTSARPWHQIPLAATAGALCAFGLWGNSVPWPFAVAAGVLIAGVIFTAFELQRHRPAEGDATQQLRRPWALLAFAGIFGAALGAAFGVDSGPLFGMVASVGFTIISYIVLRRGVHWPWGWVFVGFFLAIGVGAGIGGKVGLLVGMVTSVGFIIIGYILAWRINNERQGRLAAKAGTATSAADAEPHPAHEPSQTSSTPPPPPGRRFKRVLRQIWWTLVPIWSIGFLSFVPFLAFAAIQRRKKDWAVFAAYLVATIVMIGMVNSDSNASGAVDGFIIACAAIHACVLFRPSRSLSRQAPAVPPGPPGAEPAGRPGSQEPDRAQDRGGNLVTSPERGRGLMQPQVRS